MTWLPPGLQIVWPDGKRRHRPKDGEVFTHYGNTFVWDDVIQKWSDYRGKIVEFKEEPDPVLSMYDDWTHHYSRPETKEEEQKKEETEGDRLRDFFFPKNRLGCECGVWLTSSTKHSKHCRLYKEEE